MLLSALLLHRRDENLQDQQACMPSVRRAIGVAGQAADNGQPATMLQASCIIQVALPTSGCVHERANIDKHSHSACQATATRLPRSFLQLGRQVLLFLRGLSAETRVSC